MGYKELDSGEEESIVVTGMPLVFRMTVRTEMTVSWRRPPSLGGYRNGSHLVENTGRGVRCSGKDEGTKEKGRDWMDWG